MHVGDIQRWEHDHAFGTTARTRGELRTRWVIALTLAMMTAEIGAGVLFGSMALLADGWHMATHAAALGVTVFAYTYARRHANDRRFSFGTGKVSALGGCASAVGLAVVALFVLGESVLRLLTPVEIDFGEATLVAVVGLIVNVASALLLRDGHHHHHDHDTSHVHHDHNLRAAYLHLLADAVTSLLAIVALTSGRFLGWVWMDPIMGIVGALVIARWSYGLVRDTSRVLLDAELSTDQVEAIRRAIEGEGNGRVADLHVWRVGPRHLAAIIAIVTREPREPGHYKALLTDFRDLVHVTVEVHCPDGGAET